MGGMTVRWARGPPAGKLSAMTGPLPKLHFIAGLPRSGSTLLAGILRQNPRFHAAMTGPVGTMFGVMLNAMGAQNKTALFLTEAQKREPAARAVRRLLSAADGQGGDLRHQPGLDGASTGVAGPVPRGQAACAASATSRGCSTASSGWCARTRSRRRGCSQRRGAATVFSRVEALAHRDRVVGFAWSAFKEAYYGEHSRALLLVEYDILCRRPGETLRLVYEFLGEHWYDHDFDQVEYAEPEFDAQLATPGLHTVGRSSSPPGRRSCHPTCSRNMPGSPSGRTPKLRRVPHHRPGRGYLVRLIRPLVAGGRRGSSGRISSPSGLSQRQAQVAAHVRHRVILGSTIAST